MKSVWDLHTIYKRNYKDFSCCEIASHLEAASLSNDILPDICVSSSSVMPRQDGKVAIVTGGGRGIGYEVVRHMARLGVHVIIGTVWDHHTNETHKHGRRYMVNTPVWQRGFPSGLLLSVFTQKWNGNINDNLWCFTVIKQTIQKVKAIKHGTTQ